MKLRNKIISSVLSGVLVVSMVPFNAFAADAISSSNVVNTDATFSFSKDKLISAYDESGTPDKLLEKLVEVGVEDFFGDLLNDSNIGFKNRSVSRIFKEMKEQSAKIEEPISRLYSRCKNPKYETALNDLVKEMVQIRKTCDELADSYIDIFSATHPWMRDDMFKAFREKNVDRLANLADKLNKVFGSLSVEKRNDIISIYDEYTSQAYNFASGVSFQNRMQFRYSIVSTLIYGALIASALDVPPISYGPNTKSYKTKTQELFNNCKKLNNLVNKTRKLEEKQVKRMDRNGTTSYVYCYPLGRFVKLIDGNYHGGWKNALTLGVSKNLKEFEKPFFEPRGLGGHKWHHVKTPFGCEWRVRAFISDQAKDLFGSRYVDTNLIKELYKRIPKGGSLFSEFIDHGLNVDKDGKLVYDIDRLWRRDAMVVGAEKFYKKWSGPYIYMMDTCLMGCLEGEITTDNVVFSLRTSDIKGALITPPEKLFALEYM